jgi:1-phosphofructokinase family hexose kinase
VTSRDAGGKGVNISRALTKNGVENTALVVLGRENREEFLSCLAREGISVLEIVTEGRVRENYTLHTDGMPETRISFSGGAVNAALLSEVESAIDPLLDGECAVTLTGRVPKGIPIEAVKAFLCRLSARGVHVVIDSKSFSVKDILDCRPFLIKPNEEEIADYTSRPVKTLEDAALAAREIACGGVENVMISLGERGAVLASPAGDFCVAAPEVEVRSTVGAGDSAIAGFLAATAAGLSDGERLRTAVAFGSAACMSEGTNPPTPEAIERLMPLCIPQNK